MKLAGIVLAVALTGAPALAAQRTEAMRVGLKVLPRAGAAAPQERSNSIAGAPPARVTCDLITIAGESVARCTWEY